MRSALVIGGLGYLGSGVTARLVDLGARVTVVTPSRSRHEAAAVGYEKRGVRIVEGDLRNASLMTSTVEGQEIVFHAAGQSGAVSSMEDPGQDLDVNVRGSLTLLEALRVANRDAKIVFVGSRLEYGRVPPGLVPEDREPDPLCIYAAHKLMVERYLQLYSQVYGIRYTVARVTNPYGPGQPRSRTAFGVVNRMIHLAIGNEPLAIYGDGSQLRDYVYVDDVVEALVRMATSPQSDGRVYNVGGGVGTRLIDMARAITRMAGGGRIDQVEWPALAWRIETGDFVADVSRIGRELGWRPTVGLDEGLLRTVEHYRARVAS